MVAMEKERGDVMRCCVWRRCVSVSDVRVIRLPLRGDRGDVLNNNARKKLRMMKKREK